MKIKTNKYLVFYFLIWLLLVGCSQPQLGSINAKLSNAEVKTVDNQLVVNTGKVTRTWQLTSYGLKTVSMTNNQNGQEYANSQNELKCDWSYFGLIDESTKAKLVSLSAAKNNDEGFTSDHIEVVAEFEYPSVESSVKYIIWAYPDAPGIRTQLFIKGNAAKYLKSENSKAENIQFNLVQGEYNSNYKASAHADLNIAASTEDVEAVEYHIKGLDKNKKYKLGFTWWDFEGSGISQNVWVTSVDGEGKYKLVDNEKLPDFKNKGQEFETRLFDLPNSILMDNTFRLIFEKTAGKKAIVSEIFVYELVGDDYTLNNGHEERIQQLKKNAPEGTFLAAYLDCGVAITGEKLIPTGRVDYLPVNSDNAKVKFVAYYNDTQHRNKLETPLIKENELTFNGEIIQNNWSNFVAVEKENSGVILIKESHKCANQYGVDTGEFIIDNNGISNTGTSLFTNDITPDEYSWCWASWSVIYDGGEEGAELAIKEFDRLRYPVDKSRDIYIQANTWGSDRGRNGSKEDNVLLEIESQQELGIDIQQIDDGWQAVSIRHTDSQVEKSDKDWYVREDWYPEGWKNVVAKSKETGVKLGLWGAAQPITLGALKWNYENGGFVTYKLDFADLGTHKQMDDLMKKIRSFVKYTGHKVRVNWDLTENAPRYGYFWAKEYGCVYLENRKPKVPKNAIYVPSLVLRDIWQLSKYTNVNRFQTSIQNIEMVDRDLSDAYLYNHPYSVAIGLVGTPLFFQETHFYSAKAKKEIKALLSKYKEHRDEMYAQYVFPIGSEPNNASWTGFQWYNENNSNGYFMIFREINNKEAEAKMTVRFLKDKEVQLTNIETGESFNTKINKKGEVLFDGLKPAEFRFYRYEIIK